MVQPEGNAIVYCGGAFNTTNGKTAHGLVRFTQRYHVLSVIDSLCAGWDAGEVLDGKPKNIPIVANLEEAVQSAKKGGRSATHLVIGLAPEGGRLSHDTRQDVKRAIEYGLNVDCGLHDFLSEDPEIAELAKQKNIRIRDVRKPPRREYLHFFSGKIEEVTSLKIAVLGTDSAVGKRTTAWLLVRGLREKGYRAEMIGTGQTAWMQGVRYTIVFDSLINDFVTGEIEHVIWRAWKETRPDAIVIEGQGSLMSPAFPGGVEILAAGRPDVVVLQHAPARKVYDGSRGYPIHSLTRQIQAVELLSGKPVVAVCANHENISRDQIPAVCDAIQEEVGLPAFDVLLEGVRGLVDVLLPYLEKRK